MNLSPAWQPVTKPNGACTVTSQRLIVCAVRFHKTQKYDSGVLTSGDALIPQELARENLKG
jgi:hypothetical protein